MLATLVLATFLLPTQRRRRRSKEEYSDFPQHPPVEADRQAAVDAGRKGKFDDPNRVECWDHTSPASATL
jgi:hypothetical protein